MHDYFNVVGKKFINNAQIDGIYFFAKIINEKIFILGSINLMISISLIIFDISLFFFVLKLIIEHTQLIY